ncbi:phosphotransferase family protein [Crassaminicella profunda]|uniref:phosphotransferase family protein n=1 Tax=Crassaminicella profunda TaxID=1286698 RepID=UPI001CA6BDB0|nr:phosphotransferase [Crassaminicella profunda]QZY54868.1 phosphotransferase [Crassaminicella profunda]
MDGSMEYEARKIIHNVFHKKVSIKPVGNHHLQRHMVYVVTDENKNAVIFKLYFKKNRWNREVAALKLLQESKIKVPKIIDYGICHEKEWMITEFIEGNTFSKIQEKISAQNQWSIFKEMGKELGKIHNLKTFDFFGNWDEDGNPLEDGKCYRKVFQNKYDTVVKTLFEKNLPNRKLHEKWVKYIQEKIYILEDVKTAVLCHNDYDMRNVMIKKVQDRWNLAGIIDFEQSFPWDKDLDMVYLYYILSLKKSGYEEAFLEGYQETAKIEESFYKKMKFYLGYIGLYICSWTYDIAPDHYMNGLRILKGLMKEGKDGEFIGG